MFKEKGVGYYMNILYELNRATKKNNKLETTSLLGQTETYSFFWNPPVSMDIIEKFEEEASFKLPDDYKEFLLISNGAMIYQDEFDSGYKLLGTSEIKKATQELIELGYEIPNGCYCFMQCLFSDDIMLFDSFNSKRIIDGDVGYPIKEWNSLSCNFRTFMARLYQCNGAMFWRW